MNTMAPGFICGPTCGCGKVTPMEAYAGGWQIPEKCAHCGKVNRGPSGPGVLIVDGTIAEIGRRALWPWESALASFVPGVPDVRDVEALDLSDVKPLDRDYTPLELHAGDRVVVKSTMVGGREIAVFHIVRRWASAPVPAPVEGQP